MALRRDDCGLCAGEVVIASLDGQLLELAAREVLPLERCPRCQPAAPPPRGAIADMREHHGSVALHHRSACSAKGRDPHACSCDPAAYTTVDGKSSSAGRLPLGWTEADLAAIYGRLPRRRRRASVQLHHIGGCGAKGRDHERCVCSPSAYVVESASGTTPAGERRPRTYTPAGKLPRGWGPSDVAALLEPVLLEPVTDRRHVDVLSDHVLSGLERGTCGLCRGRGEIGEALDRCALYAIDEAGGVRPATLSDRAPGDALHREHAVGCHAISQPQAA